MIEDIYTRIARQKRQNEDGYRAILSQLTAEQTERLRHCEDNPPPMKKQCIVHRPKRRTER